MANAAATEMGARVLKHFQRVHREVFRGDPLLNPKLMVEVVAEVTAEDTPSLVLITPWTLNGMAFPPDGELPDSLAIGGRSYPVFVADIEGIGVAHSVNLAATVAGMGSQDAARSAALAVAPLFQEALRKARESAHVADPGKRRLFGLDPG